MANVPVRAQGTVCAGVQLQISQQVTFERQAFNATMTISNGLTTTALTNLSVQIYFTDASGNPISSTTDPNATGSTFFMKPPTVRAFPIPLRVANRPRSAGSSSRVQGRAAIIRTARNTMSGLAASRLESKENIN